MPARKDNKTPNLYGISALHGYARRSSQRARTLLDARPEREEQKGRAARAQLRQVGHWLRRDRLSARSLSFAALPAVSIAVAFLLRRCGLLTDQRLGLDLDLLSEPQVFLREDPAQLQGQSIKTNDVELDDRNSRLLIQRQVSSSRHYPPRPPCCSLPPWPGSATLKAQIITQIRPHVVRVAPDRPDYRPFRTRFSVGRLYAMLW